ncbi:MAG: YCF48-related protein [Pseudomonadota bacterium]
MNYHAVKKIITCAALCVLSLGTGPGCKGVQQTAPKKPPFTLVTSSHLFGIAAPDQTSAWIVGVDGLILHTADEGKTWEQQQSTIQTSLCDVAFINAKSGWISGRTGIVIHTEDGGKTWIKQDTGISTHLFALTFIDELYGWAVGDFGTIVHTADGGKTWVQQGAGEDKIYNDVCFVDRTRGWVVGEYGTIYGTADGGATWVKQECPDIVPVASETEWEAFPPSLYGVSFMNDRQGWASGMDGVIISTADGGATWKKIKNPAEQDKVTLYKIKGSGSTCFAVGQKGFCVYSRDAGKTWDIKKAETNTKSWLRDLDIIDEQRGFAVGSRGTILKTADGATTWTMVSGIPLRMN